MNGLADGKQQMRFSKPGISVDKQGVIFLPARMVRHGFGCGIGKLVGVAHDKPVKRETFHLRQHHVGSGRLLCLQICLQLIVPGKNPQFAVTGEQIVHGVFDDTAETGEDDILSKLVAHTKHHSPVAPFNRPAVGKPGLDGSRRQGIGKDLQYGIPDILNRIH